MKYTFDDLKKMQHRETKEKVFVFDETTQQLEFVNLSGNTGLMEIRFDKPQPKLRYLDASRCNIGKIVFTEACEKLQSLYLHHNNLFQIEFVVDLPKLELLDVSFNINLKEIEPGARLPNLKYLYLHSCNIRSLQAFTSHFTRPGFDFNIDKNVNLESPPVEIVKKGKDAVVNFFKELDKSGFDYLFEAKLILVGEERAGKSTIAKALSQEKFSIDLNEKSTEGIDIRKWIISSKNCDTDKNFRFNIWDFGGQEIYHATHQFFLTKRSLYLFVTEARKDLRFDDFYYWLNIINTLAGDSPIIAIQNKADQPHKETSIEEYKKVFTQIYEGLQKVSCNTEHKNWDSKYSLTLEMLKQSIYDILRSKKLSGIGDKLPKAWVQIRGKIADLQSQDLNYISLNEYFEICNKHGLNQKEALFLSDYFHDLGVFLHFRNNVELRNTIFLNYEWVTKGIYNVFDNDKIKNKTHGVFTDEDLIEIWSEPQFRNKQSDLINLMKNQEFKICFQHAKGYYLAPQLFNDDKVEYQWRTKEDNLIFRYNYAFMPKGILSQLIVMLNQNIYKDTFWKYGVLFAYKNSRAIVIENRYENENIIKIRVEGIEKRELLTIIGSKIEEINSSYTNLKVSEEFACICDECILADNPYYFDAKTINNFINKEKKYLICLKSTEQVEINKLLGNYIPIEQIKAFEQMGVSNITNIYGNNNFVGQGNKKRDLSYENFENPNETTKIVMKQNAKKRKNKLYILLIVAIIFAVTTVIISQFYSDIWQILAPSALVILGFVAFWDKLLGIVHKSQDISKG